MTESDPVHFIGGKPPKGRLTRTLCGLPEIEVNQHTRRWSGVTCKECKRVVHTTMRKKV